MRREFVLASALTVLFLLSACTPSQSGESSTMAHVTATPVVNHEVQSEASKREKETTEDTPEETAKQVIEEAAADPERPAWQQVRLTNARTSEEFSLADFTGKTVFVEPMATWCSNCRRQLTNVLEAKQQLAEDEVIFVALSVETTIDDSTLAKYADGAGFDWLFAVVSPELLSQLVDQFGRTIANPPATPHFVIRADGSFTELVTGIESAAQIITQIKAAQG